MNVLLLSLYSEMCLGNRTVKENLQKYFHKVDLQEREQERGDSQTTLHIHIQMFLSNQSVLKFRY